MSENPYRLPNQDTVFGSLESGIRGEYELHLPTIIKEAWDLQNGNKTKIWTALLTTGVMSVISFMLLAEALGVDIEKASESDDLLISLVLQLGMTALIVPLTTGLIMMVIKLAAGTDATPKEVFNYFDYTPKLIVWAVLQSIITNIGLILLLVPGIYLAVAYQLSLPVMIEKNLNPWRALESSRQAITKHWFKFFFVTMSLGLLTALSFITIIGPIFTIPWYLCTVAVIYRKVFGFEDGRPEPKPFQPIVPPNISNDSNWSGTQETDSQAIKEPEPYRAIMPPEIKPEPGTPEDEDEK